METRLVRVLLYVAEHLRGMRPTLTNEKDTLMLRRNLNIIYFLLDFKL